MTDSSREGNVQPWRENVETVRGTLDFYALTAGHHRDEERDQEAHTALDALTTQLEELERKYAMTLTLEGERFLRVRAEAAEQRVKALEEALRPFTESLEQTALAARTEESAE